MASEILIHAEVASTIDLLSAWIEAQMAYNGQPGISIGVVYDQELLWARGFGYANVEQKIAAMPQTIYRIASITKLFTSTAILQLRDAGKLQLDDPITRHLSWFNIQNRYADAPPSPYVTCSRIPLACPAKPLSLTGQTPTSPRASKLWKLSAPGNDLPSRNRVEILEPWHRAGGRNCGRCRWSEL